MAICPYFLKEFIFFPLTLYFIFVEKDKRMVEEEKQNGLAFPPWQRFNDWVHCICVITFDLELGQKIEVISPGDAQLTKTEKLNICYMAFPDSNSYCTRDTAYHFRIRRSNGVLTKAQENFELMVPLQMQPSTDFFYGFVHFRQQKNPALPRGYYQKSVVLLSVLPLFGLFSYVVNEIAHSFFEFGESVIELACKNIDRWPAPSPGETLSLNLINTFLNCRIPCRKDIIQNQFILDSQYNSSVGTFVILPSIHETNFYDCTKSILSHIQLLWEIVLLGEPILAMAPTPALCSQLVQSLVSIISPLRYFNDFRPFFTIHDSDFNEITSQKTLPPNIIIGVTNPFFSKALKHWPHILRIGDASSAGQVLNSEKLLKKMSDGKKLDTNPGLYSKYKPYLRHDKSLAKKLLKMGQGRTDAVQNTILRRHFLDLTQNFMIPLERYITTLMPLKKHLSPFKSAPQMKPFNLDDFLGTLHQTGLLLTCGIKGDLKGFYRRFITTSPNFDGWIQQRLKDVNCQLRLAHLESLSTADLRLENLDTRSHVEIVDFVLKLINRLTELGLEDPEKERIQFQLNNVMQSVDEELRSILLSNDGLREVIEL